MAIKQQPMIKDFWPRYKRKVYLGAIGMGLLLTVIVLLAVISTTGLPRDITGYIAFIVAVVTGSISLNIILVYLVTIPLKNLTDALTHLSGEPSTVTPPNPNSRLLEQNGLKPLVQYLYQSASSAYATPSNTTANIELLGKAFNNTRAGIVILDTAGNIKYANTAAPIITDTNGNKQLELIFEQKNALKSWLSNVRDKQVHANCTWLRVPNKITGEENRRIFDIAATFEKGNDADRKSVV